MRKQEEKGLDELDEIVRNAKKKLVSWKVLLQRHDESNSGELGRRYTRGSDKLDAILSELVDLTKRNVMERAHDSERVEKASVKLSTLQIPRFDGDIMQFPEFIDMFTSAIHGNKALSDVERLVYLKSYLGGSVLDTISGLTITASNYNIALTLLKERFDKPELVTNAMYNRLVALKPPANKFNSLRRFQNEMESCLRSLGTACENIADGVLLSLLLSKLPKDVIIALETQKGDGAWTIATLRKYLNNYVESRERAEFLSAGSGHLQCTERVQADALVANSTPKPSPRCWYCRAEHYSDECTKYNTLEQRKAQFTSQCFICLRKGHIASVCQSTRPCFHCGKNTHHRSLCPVKFKSTPTLNAMTSAFTPADATVGAFDLTL